MSEGCTPRVLLLNGSERAGGNTDRVAAVVGDTVRCCGGDFVEHRLRDYAIEPCGLCGECNTRVTPCAVPDDVAFLVDRMAEADAIIYAVPVHGFGMAELMQRFVERAGVGFLRFDRPLANKVGGAIVTGRRYNHEHVMSQLIYNMMLNRMILPGAGYPAIVHGGAPGSGLADQEGMDVVRGTVRRITNLATYLKHPAGDAHRRALLDMDTANERMAPVSRGTA